MPQPTGMLVEIMEVFSSPMGVTPIKILTPPTKKWPGGMWLKPNIFGEIYVISA